MTHASPYTGSLIAIIFKICIYTAYQGHEITPASRLSMRGQWQTATIKRSRETASCEYTLKLSNRNYLITQITAQFVTKFSGKKIEII